MQNEESEYDTTQHGKKDALNPPNYDKHPNDNPKYRQPSNQKRYHDEEQEHRHNKSREKQKTTAIALSVITCLFMCVIGYEIIHENHNKEEEQANAHKKERKGSIIASKAKYSENLKLLSDGEDEIEDNHENYQIQLLREQNKQQTAKIKALRQELLEKMQNINDVKASLFRQEGDPKDKSKIAELGHKLTEKEQHNQELAIHIRSLESNQAELQKKIVHLEVTRDALAAMFDTQRKSKEQELNNLKQDIENLQTSVISDKSNLTQKVHTYETTQQYLAVSLEQKTSAMGHLENELQKHVTELEQKGQELQRLFHLYASNEEELRQDVINLVDNLEWEVSSKQLLERDLSAALEKKSKTIVALKQELRQQRTLIADKSDEVATQSLLLNQQEETSKEQASTLITSLEWEITRTRLLQSELGSTLDQHTQNIKDSTGKIHQLESEIETHRSLLTTKGQEFLSYADLYSYGHEQIQSQLQNVIASQELETSKSHRLQQELEEVDTYRQNLELELESLKLELATFQNQAEELKQKLSAQEILVAAHQMQLTALLDSHQEGSQSSKSHIENLTLALEKEKSQQETLKQQLEETLAKYNSDHEQTLSLEQQLKDVSLSAVNLEDSLATTQELISTKENEIKSLTETKKDLEEKLSLQIAQLTNDFGIEKAKGAEIQQKFDDHLNLYHEEKKKINELEETLKTVSSRLQEREQELTIAESKLTELSPQLDILGQERKNLAEIQTKSSELEKLLADTKDQLNTKNVDLEQARSQLTNLQNEREALISIKDKSEDLEKRYQSNLVKYTEDERNLSALEDQLISISEKLNTKESELETTKLTLEKSAAALDKLTAENIDLRLVKAKSAEYEVALQENLAKYADEQKKIQDLEQEISLLSEQLKNKERDLDLAQDKVTETASKLEQYNADNQHLSDAKNQIEKELSQQYEEAKAKLTAEQYAKKELEDQVDLLKQELQDKADQLSTTMSLLEEASSENERLTLLHNKASEYEQKYLESQTQLNDEHGKINALNQELATLSQQLQEKQSEYTTLQAKLEHASENLARIETENSQLKSSGQSSVDLEQKLEEVQTKLESEQNRIAELETLQNQLTAQLREKELAIENTQNSLNETSEKLSKLSSEKDQLLQEKEDVASLYQDQTEALTIKQGVLDKLTVELEQTHLSLQKAIADYELQKSQAQKYERKLQTAALKSTVIEDELHLNKATLETHSNAIESLKRSEISLKNDYQQQIAKLLADLESEESQASALKGELQTILQNYLSEQQRADKLHQELQETQKTVIALEDQLDTHKVTTEAQIADQHSSQQDQLSKLESDLEEQKISNQSLQSELKSLLNQYFAEQKKSQELEQKMQELISESERNVPNDNHPVHYRLNNEVIEVSSPEPEYDHNEQNSYYQPDNNQNSNNRSQSRWDRMSEYKSGSR